MRPLNAEADQIAGTELQIELLARRLQLKFLQLAAAQTMTLFDQRLLLKVFRIEKFYRVSALQLCCHSFTILRLGDTKADRADVQRRVAKTASILPDRRQQIILTLLQQRFIGNGTRGDYANHFAFNQSFASGWIADLLADGDRFI